MALTLGLAQNSCRCPGNPKALPKILARAEFGDQPQPSGRCPRRHPAASHEPATWFWSDPGLGGSAGEGDREGLEESSSSVPTLPDIRHRLVGKDRLIVATRPGHPLTTGPLTLERYAAAEHLTVSRRGSLRDPIDDALTTRGLQRRVVAVGPTAAFALQLALDTDLIVTLPEAVTRTAREQLGLATLPPPLPLPDVPLYLLWHQRYDNDRAHTWLRDLATKTVKALFTPPTAPQQPLTGRTGK